MKVFDLLQSMPGVGKIRARRSWSGSASPSRRRLRGLGAKQIAALEPSSPTVADVTTSTTAGGRRRLVVLAGPTAVGKGTVAACVRERAPRDLDLRVGHDPVSPDPGEVDGVHYHFVSAEEFDRLVAEDGLLEWAVVHGSNRYGTPRGAGRGAARRRESRPCSRSTCRARARCASDAGGAFRASSRRPAGTSWSSSGRPRHRGRGGARASPGDRARRAGRRVGVRRDDRQHRCRGTRARSW